MVPNEAPTKALPEYPNATDKLALKINFTIREETDRWFVISSEITTPGVGRTVYQDSRLQFQRSSCWPSEISNEEH